MPGNRKIYTFADKWNPCLENVENQLNAVVNTSNYRKQFSDFSTFVEEAAMYQAVQEELRKFVLSSHRRQITPRYYDEVADISPFIRADKLGARARDYAREWREIREAGWLGFPEHEQWMKDLKKRL